MPNCYYCGLHFKTTAYNNTTACDDCLDVVDNDLFVGYDDEDKLAIDNVLNPTGKTQAVIYD